MITKDLTLYRGDDYPLEIAILNADGTPANLLGADIRLGFSDGMSDEVTYADITVNNNVVSAMFTHQATKDIDWANGLWDLQITQNGLVTTVARGKIKLIRDVTP